MNAAARIEETTDAQRRAADPALSAFVSANAGAGKTRVLTNRVARLLLDGVNPSTVLCITFTKAAAAEMSDRLFKLLGGWALANDAKLRKALAELDGSGAERSAEELARARRLFARALETPGGLKIQTIHSFCESVLKRFPLEAGIAPGFTVIEEREADDLMRESVARVAAAADGEVAVAFSHLLAHMTGDSLRNLVEDAIGKRRLFARADEIGWRRLGDEVAAALGVEPGQSTTALIDQLLNAILRDSVQAALEAFEATGGNPAKYFSAPIRRYLESTDPAAKLAALRTVFLKSDGEPRNTFGTKATHDIDASVEPSMLEAQRLFLLSMEEIHSTRALENTRALFSILERCFAEYAEKKAVRATLDFDDLIAKTKTLLNAKGGAQWVLYKLDMGLAHILLDEAQDTGPDAWSVIEAPLREFFAGVGAQNKGRTFFAVGDQKQSIYSFQGADAALLNEKEKQLGKDIAATQPYANVPLRASFRTTAPVLQFVDALFAPEEVIENVSADRLEHFCTRDGAAGLVELWPLVPMVKSEKPDPWDAPLDASARESRPRILANEIARTIAQWLKDGEPLQSQGRPVEPGDIMILVQSRGGQSKNALFVEMIRALGAAGVPVAGADKIALMKDQGVLDLVSYARAVLFEGDDLSLAETLKSPFFGVNDDDLYDLAAERGSQSLWTALKDRNAENEQWRRASDEISSAREVALNEGAAAFFTHILDTGVPSGWQRLAGRLGAPCREPIEEFLRQAHEFETLHPRSLRLFLDEMQRSGAEVSREASEAGPTVRVMTAHKAKGLEANIVFLIDAHRHPPVRNAGDLLTLAGPHGDDVPVLALGDARDSSRLIAAREDKKRLMRDEYRRLLYVAATRARDRLYICGHESGNDKNPHSRTPSEKSWHALAEDAFGLLGDGVADGDEKFGGRVRRLATVQTGAAEPEKRPSSFKSDRPLPVYLRTPARAETRPRRLSPSALVTARAESSAYSPGRGRDAYQRGRALHRLLELLPEIDPEKRRGAADRLLDHHAAGFSNDDRVQMREEALRVLDDPQFADVFAPGGHAEISIGGAPRGARKGLLLSGQIDRLAVLPDRILVVDYKTNRPPPHRIEDVPRAYIAQMAAYRALLQEIYPGRKIETALLWTYDARLMAIPDEALDHAHAMTLA